MFSRMLKYGSLTSLAGVLSAYFMVHNWGWEYFFQQALGWIFGGTFVSITIFKYLDTLDKRTFKKKTKSH